MSTPRGNSYQAEILRHVHDTYHGDLIDADIGVTRRLMNELGNKGGKNLASLAATLSHLEARGCIVTEFSPKRSGGKMRTRVLILEEPPAGTTEYVDRSRRTPATDGDVNPMSGKFPTAEEVAAELLRQAVAAAQVPVSDIVAMRHHIECLQEEISTWEEVAADLETQLAERAKPSPDADDLARRLKLLNDQLTSEREKYKRQARDLDTARAGHADTMADFIQLKAAFDRLTTENEKLRDANRVLKIAANMPAESYLSGLIDETLRHDLDAVLKRGPSHVDVKAVVDIVAEKDK